MLGLAFLCHLVGSVVTLGTPYLRRNRIRLTYVLCVGDVPGRAANGLVEIGINPLAATIYPKEKTHRLNVLHAWWPGGLMLGGFLRSAISWTCLRISRLR